METKEEEKIEEKVKYEPPLKLFYGNNFKGGILK